jgi:hypothetical protein
VSFVTLLPSFPRYEQPPAKKKNQTVSVFCSIAPRHKYVVFSVLIFSILILFFPLDHLSLSCSSRLICLQVRGTLNDC